MATAPPVGVHTNTYILQLFQVVNIRGKLWEGCAIRGYNKKQPKKGCLKRLLTAVKRGRAGGFAWEGVVFCALYLKAFKSFYISLVLLLY